MLEIIAILLVITAATKSRDRSDSWMAIAFIVVVALILAKCAGGG